MEVTFEFLSRHLSKEWHNIGRRLGIRETELHSIRKENDSIQNAIYNMLIHWKRTRGSEASYETLIKALESEYRKDLADDLRSRTGLDDEIVVELAKKLCFEWTLLAKHFGYGAGVISRRFGSTDQLNMSHIMLKEWLNANKENDTKETNAKLYNGLKVIGRDDIVQWLEERLSDAADDTTSTKHDTNHRQENTPTSARFDRIVMGRIQKAAPQMKGDVFMNLLHMTNETVRAHMPKSVSYENDPIVAILCAWKMKMYQEGNGETEIIQKLKALFLLYGMDNVAAVLPDLPPTSLQEISTPEFTVYSMVEVDWDGKIRPGVIRWIGRMKGLENHGEIAGIELEDSLTVGGTNGWFCNVKYFTCEAGKGLFLPLKRCRPQSTYLFENETSFRKTEYKFTSRSPKKEANLKKIGQEVERQRKLLREVDDLRGQLENQRSKYVDTLKRLEESHKMMLTLKSRNDELEAELHRTKLNLTFQQEEGERLKKELKDCKKQTRLGNEPVEESTEGYSGDASSTSGMTECRSLEDFGKFQFHLSSHLTRDIIRDLTLVLAFSPTESEEAEDDKIKFIRLLSRKGLISPTDITKLTNALDEIGHHGVLNAVKNLFNRNSSEAFR